MHSGFGAASGTIHLLPKGLAMPCGWLLGPWTDTSTLHIPSGLVAGTEKCCNLPTHGQPHCWLGGKQISPEDPLLIYKLGQHRVKTTVKYKDHLIQGKGKLP